LCALAAASLGVFTSAAAAAPLEAYGRLPAIEEIAISPDGARIAYVVTDGENRHVVVNALEPAQKLFDLVAGQRKLRAIGWAGPDHLLITTSTTSRVAGLQTTRAEWYVATDLDLDRVPCLLVGCREEDRRLRVADQGAVAYPTTRAHAGARVTLVSASDDRKKIIVEVDRPTAGPTYALIDLNAHTSTWLGEAYPALKPEDIAPVRPVAFKARDGLALSGYLSLPLGKAPKGLPLVVLPHGGPAARDEPGFDWWSQALASRGYAVLRVNFRGSEGLGSDLLVKGFGEFGRKMQTDLSDGVAYLAAQGIADPARVCIVGASYGGYAALAGATFDPGVYRAPSQWRACRTCRAS
jgi:hypothetical protein